MGTWTLVSAQSSLMPADTLTVTDANGAVHVVMAGETHLDFTAKPGAHNVPVPGNPGFNTVDLRRIDKRQAELTEKKNGAVVAIVREQISKDGSELTVTTTLPGRPGTVTVWTRSGGVKNAADPLAGQWIADASKTRLSQGLVVKIDPDGSGGVRFAADDSYTARLDGKPYSVKNSRNDTVSLQLVDPHTVDAIYRRDDQVSQKDRWVVSADGKLMTVTTTATLETGQRLTEKLVFKKQ